MSHQGFQITLRGLPTPEEIESSLRRRIDRLAGSLPKVSGGRVLVEALHSQRPTETPYRIRFELALPAGTLSWSGIVRGRPCTTARALRFEVRWGDDAAIPIRRSRSPETAISPSPR